MTHIGGEAVLESDLHRYVDGELPAARRAEVEGYLATHPNHAARVAEFCALTLTLHRLYGAHQPSNPRIEALIADLDRALHRRRFRRRLLRLAAGALLLAVGAGLVSAHPGVSGGIGDRVLGREAADAGPAGTGGAHRST